MPRLSISKRSHDMRDAGDNANDCFTAACQTLTPDPPLSLSSGDNNAAFDPFRTFLIVFAVCFGTLLFGVPACWLYQCRARRKRAAAAAAPRPDIELALRTEDSAPRKGGDLSRHRWSDVSTLGASSSQYPAEKDSAFTYSGKEKALHDGMQDVELHLPVLKREPQSRPVSGMQRPLSVRVTRKPVPSYCEGDADLTAVSNADQLSAVRRFHQLDSTPAPPVAV